MNKYIIKISFLYFFLLFIKVATKRFKTVAYIIFLLDIAIYRGLAVCYTHGSYIHICYMHTHLIFAAILGDKFYYYPHFPGEE